MERRSLLQLGLVSAMALGLAAPAFAQDKKPILIGVNTAIQLQVGRDAVNAVKQAVDEVNQKGGVLGRRLEMIVADEGEAVSEGPKTGIAAVNKLTGENKVDVLIGGSDRRVARPHRRDIG